MEMEKEEQQNLLEQEEMEELEETTLFIRKSRTETVSKTTEIAAFDFEVSDAVSEIMSNGYKVHSELVENEGKTPAEEQEIEKLNGVLEKEPEAINGGQAPAEEQEIEKLDEVLEKEPEAINGGQAPAEEQEIEKLDGVLEKESEAINGEQKSQNLVFHDNVEGVDSTFTYLKEKQILKEPESKEFDFSSLDFVVQSNSTSALYNGYEVEIENNNISSSKLKLPQVSVQEGPTSSAEIESEAVELINEDDLEVTDFDVERVIQNQTTHDLYCPNCSSCITKRVILRKRKRAIRISDEEFKGKTPKTAPGPEVDQSRGDGVDDDAQITLADEDKRDREPHLFRCLSCFTFFIPTGDGLKCLPLKDWFASMFTPNKHGPVIEPGSISQTRGEPSSNLSDQGGQPSFSQKPRSPANASEARVEGGDEISPLLSQEPSVNGNVANGVEDKLDLKPTVTIGTTIGLPDSYTQDQFKEPKSSQVVHNNHESDLYVSTFPTRTQVTKWKPVKDAIVFSQGGGKFPISAHKGSSTLEESDEVQIPNQTEAADKEIIHHSPTSISATDVEGKLNISVSIPHEEHDVRASITTDTVHEYNNANFLGSNNGHFHHTKGSEHTITTTNITFSNEPPKVDSSVVNNGAIAPDTKITIHPSETPSVPELVNQVTASDSARTEYEIEVVKSIVYGGLAESITSLSVVSSAAGGGAATLNVLALGAANLIGGLFIICHNLWDLRYHQLEHVSNQINEGQDRYKELLGRRQSFVLHAVLAIISYITFGLVPPLVYGFSFRNSDDRQLKLAVVGPVSILCILILAISKAYTQRAPKPYLKTIATYLVLGFMVSGVSYVAGELVERLLNELGLFQTSSVPNVEMKPTGSGWASY
ncbi:hypothetical protein ACS0TY_000326 [Phlomoides rotata]